jgi:GntR family transcriptional repressor for pyruvate dehydrogenase complex
LSEMITFEPLEKKRYSEQIANLIQEKILKDRLNDGYRLPTERALAEEWQVSRSVIREAIRILDAHGFVRIKKGPQGGIFVSLLYHKPVSASLKSLADHGRITVDHLFEVRLQIEPYIAESAMKSATRSDIDRLVRLMEDAAAHFDDPGYLKQKNIEFHLVLAEISQNPVYMILMQSITEILLKLAYDFLNPEFERELFHVHDEIVQVIAGRKKGNIKKLLREDIMFVKSRLKESVEVRPRAPDNSVKHGRKPVQKKQRGEL